MKRKAIDDENKPYYYEDYRDSKNYLKPREFFINSINKQGLKGFLYNNDDMRINIQLLPNTAINLTYYNLAAQLYIQNIKHLKNINDIYFVPYNKQTEKYIKTKENIFKIESNPKAFVERFTDILPLTDTINLSKNYNKIKKNNDYIKKYNINKIDKNISNGQVIFSQLIEMNLRCISNNIPYKPKDYFTKKQLEYALDFQRKNPDKVFEIMERTTIKLTNEKKENMTTQIKKEYTLREKIKENVKKYIQEKSRKRL